MNKTLLNALTLAGLLTTFSFFSFILGKKYKEKQIKKNLKICGDLNVINYVNGNKDLYLKLQTSNTINEIGKHKYAVFNVTNVIDTGEDDDIPVA